MMRYRRATRLAREADEVMANSAGDPVSPGCRARDCLDYRFGAEVAVTRAATPRPAPMTSLCARNPRPAEECAPPRRLAGVQPVFNMAQVEHGLSRYLGLLR
jgi:hypothetical protein